MASVGRETWHVRRALARSVYGGFNALRLPFSHPISLKLTASDWANILGLGQRFGLGQSEVTTVNT